MGQAIRPRGVRANARTVTGYSMLESLMSASRNNLVNYAVEGGVAVLTLNDPPGNAATHEMMKELDEAIIEARFDSDVHALVITGAGERVFSCGTNLEVLRQVDETFAYYYYLHTHETLQRLENTPKLVVAAINGQCLDGGFELALACDLRIGRRGAGRIGLTEVRQGRMPGAGATQRLPRLLGQGRALSMLLEGDAYDMDHAQSLGLLHRVIDAPAAAFVAQVVEAARQLGPPHRSAQAIGRIKRAVRTTGEGGLDLGLAMERELHLNQLSCDDASLVTPSQRRPTSSGR
jgi:enoyl-CoA hydratase